MPRAAIVVRGLVHLTGTTRNIGEQVRMLDARGWDVDVYVRDLGHAAFGDARAAVHRVGTLPFRGYAGRVAFARRVERRLARARHDLVLGHGDNLRQDVLFLHNCVHAEHEAVHGRPGPDDPKGRFHARLLAHGAFRLVVANSALMARDLERRWGIEPSRIEVVHPGYDPERFRVDDRERLRDAGRAELGLARDELAIGLVTSGAFAKRGVPVLFDALARLPEAVRRTLRVFVAGKDAGVASFAALAARAAPATVRFLEPRGDVERLYHALDLQVLPALWEEFGRVVLEGMACGLPVVTTDRVGAAELLPDGSRGDVLPAGDAAALAGALARFVADPEAARARGRENAAVAAGATARVRATQLEALLERRGLLAARASGAPRA